MLPNNILALATLLSPHRYETQQRKLGFAYEPPRWVNNTESSTSGFRMMGFAERGTIVEVRYYRGMIPGASGSLEERFWVRIKLQHPKEDMQALVEYHVNAGTGEFIVDSKRYDEAMGHNWRPGDRCQMFWQDNDDPTDGEWYGGTVVSCTSVKCVHCVIG